MYKYYVGIGSRQTPLDILGIITKLATQLSKDGYVLHSGGAKGADTAFEDGAGTNKNIFYANDATPEAINLASQFHPAWNRCTGFVRKLHGRNAMILLNQNLDMKPKFIVCWTPGAAVVGGTGLGLRIAEKYDILVQNLADSKTLKDIERFLEASKDL